MTQSDYDFCAYCGMHSRTEREHVVPMCLFPESTRASANFVLVPACRACNREVSGDEEDLRNFCSMAGEDIPEARELFYGSVMRSLKRQPYGRGALARIWGKMNKDDELNRYRISADEGTFRALRKIVRGLTYYDCKEVVRDDRVEVKVCPYAIPPGLDETDAGMHVIHSNVLRYWTVPNLPEDRHSFWFLSILRTRNSIAVVYP
jgi:hypothetical protein